MALAWLENIGNRHHGEYARAYERAIKTGSIDCAISWELGGFRCEDGTIVTDAPDQVKESLKNNSLYADALQRVEDVVKSMREARYISQLSAQLSHNGNA